MNVENALEITLKMNVEKRMSKKNIENVLERTLNKRCIYFKITFTMNVVKGPEITKYAILEMNIEITLKSKPKDDLDKTLKVMFVINIEITLKINVGIILN